MGCKDKIRGLRSLNEGIEEHQPGEVPAAARLTIAPPPAVKTVAVLTGQALPTDTGQ